LQTGGSAFWATSTKSSFFFFAFLIAFSKETIPTCSPSESINLTLSALIFEFTLGFLIILLNLIYYLMWRWRESNPRVESFTKTSLQALTVWWVID